VIATRAGSSSALRVLPLVALVATGGCFATRSDVRLVQSDIASMRTELLKAHADENAGLVQAMRTLQVASDSVRVMSNRLTAIQGDVRGGLRGVNDQLIQVQELLKQSASAIQKVRADNEARFNQPVFAPPPSAGVPDTTLMPQTPTGPNNLYRDGMANLNRNSTSTARNAFQELLTKYPTSDLAPQAQLGIAQTYFNEKQYSAAQAAFSAVVAKYPDAPQAPTALYKSANLYITQGDHAKARLLLQQIVTKYRTSDEYETAIDLLKTLK
jgi:tol-pal system protein YbgF